MIVWPSVAQAISLTRRIKRVDGAVTTARSVLYHRRIALFAKMESSLTNRGKREAVLSIAEKGILAIQRAKNVSSVRHLVQTVLTLRITVQNAILICTS